MILLIINYYLLKLINFNKIVVLIKISFNCLSFWGFGNILFIFSDVLVLCSSCGTYKLSFSSVFTFSLRILWALSVSPTLLASGNNQQLRAAS